MGSDIDGEAAADDISGSAVSLSSDGLTVAIGAHRNDANGENSGHVRVYKFESVNSVWLQMGSAIDGEAKFDSSRVAVSLSSDGLTVAIGAHWDNGNGVNSGHVRVYKFESVNSVWLQIGSDIDGEAAYDYSGRVVSLSSDGLTVAIGAIGNDANGSDSGHVRVFKLESNEK